MASIGVGPASPPQQSSLEQLNLPDTNAAHSTYATGKCHVFVQRRATSPCAQYVQSHKQFVRDDCV